MKKTKNKKDICPKTYTGKHIWLHELHGGWVMTDEINKCIACGLIDDRR